MKKILAILLTMVMVISLFAGCDDGHDHDSTTAPTEVITDPTGEVVTDPTIVETEVPVETTVPETEAPTEEPTEEPTEAPTEVPTEAPTEEPTEAPTEAPVKETEPVHQHSYERKLTTPPTCSYGGEATYTCACGHSYKEAVPKNEHVWSEWVVTREPTTTTYGQKVRECELCYGAQFESIDPLPADDDTDAACAAGMHTYIVNARKEPTCEEYGHMSSICSVCGEPGMLDIIPPTGHSWGEWVSAGGTDTRTCSVCGKTETRKTPATICEEHGYSHIMSDADKARLTEGDYFYEVNCVCGLSCIGSSYDDAWAKFNAHAAEKQWSYCGEVRWESEGHWVEFPDSTYVCARCGTVAEFRHYLCRTSS